MRANIPTGSYGALGLCSTPAKSVWREPFFSWRISGKSVGWSRSRQRSAKRRSRRFSGRSIRPAAFRTVCVLLFPVARNIKLPVRKQPQLVDAKARCRRWPGPLPVWLSRVHPSLTANADRADRGFQLLRGVGLAHECEQGHVLEELPQFFPTLTAGNDNGQRRIDGTHLPH
jgi:hypothetical protein